MQPQEAERLTKQVPHFYVYKPGSSFYVREGDGAILRADGMSEGFSDSWRVNSIYQARPFGRLSEVRRDWRIILRAMADGKLSPSFKNGKPKFFIGDFDHGSNRVQMSPRFFSVTYYSPETSA